MPAGDEALVGQEELRDLLFGGLPQLPSGERETMFARTFDPDTPDPDVPLPADDTWDLFPTPSDDAAGDGDPADASGPFGSTNEHDVTHDVFVADGSVATPDDGHDGAGAGDPDVSSLAVDSDHADTGADVAADVVADVVVDDEPGDTGDAGYDEPAVDGGDGSEPFGDAPAFEHQPDPPDQTPHEGDPW